MRKAYLFFGFLVIFICGCSAGRSEPQGAPNYQFSPVKIEKFTAVYCAMAFREAHRYFYPTEDRFYITYDEKLVLPLSETHALPYPGVNVEVHFPPLRPNTTYCLYCPLTGCPKQPELLQEFRTDEEGHLFPPSFFEKLKENNIHCNSMPFFILLYANPGYCSDWYLITCTDPGSVVQTTFTYKPITVTGTDGRTLTLCKKEPGGNIIEILLTNFPPKKELLMTSVSAGEKLTRVINTKDDGSYVSKMAPQVIGCTKGVDHITISCDGESLEASCPWDMSTLDIKRVQPPTDMWPIMLSFGRLIKDSQADDTSAKASPRPKKSRRSKGAKIRSRPESQEVLQAPA